MFAVVRTGGKQYRVAAGDKIVVEKLAGEAGDTITLGDILIAGEGADLRATDGLTVSAEIIAQAKAEKVIVFKKRRRHNYRRKKGHRQQHTILRILGIGDEKQESKPKKAKTAAPASESAAPTPVEETQVAATPVAETAAPAAEAPAKKARAPKADAPEVSTSEDAQAAEPAKIEGAESEMTDTPAPAKKPRKKAE
ncbi:MAG: rplU [Alphaproteobacteria bacterium]|nr:rplU [Alphaproteobacteria bacterium]MDB5721477.1 rplU [Alphaproteobacteria bacterium]